MKAERAAVVRTRYPARAVVVTDLNGLCGPSHSIAELPLRLYWSDPIPVFDPDEPYMQYWLYPVVLRVANCPQDLTSYLHQDTLIAYGQS